MSEIELTETDTEPESPSEDVTAFQHFELANGADIEMGESCGATAVAHGVTHVLAMTIETEPNPLMQQMNGDEVEEEGDTVQEGRMFISDEGGEVGLAVAIVEDDEVDDITIDDVVDRFHESDLLYEDT
jgi:hypothetical protein